MDRPEPGESLFANIVWSYYNGEKNISVEENIIKNFLENDDFRVSTLKKGNPGSFIMNINTNLQPYESRDWFIVADVHKSHIDLQNYLKKKKKNKNLIEKIEDDVNNTHTILETAIGAADGFQISRKNINDMHHTSNVLFNILRGGVFLSNYDINLNDFYLFIKSRNKLVFHENIKEIQKLKSPLTLYDLQNLSRTVTDPSLKRLYLEYLPLILARRHGDPSRPWNHFEIRMKKKDGSQRFFYEGNWRDIFQNWEALGQSYPLIWESIASKFLNAITVDGFNPYRLNSEGIDWEIIDPEDTWSFIGYWNDHQVIYLLKILENFHRHYPSKLEALLVDSVFSYANVPYQIKTFDQILSNPKATIQFDFAKNEKINELVKTDLEFVLKNVQTEIEMQIDFRNTLINQNDPKLAELLSISQSTLKNRFRDNVENYEDEIEELKYFLTKDYVRTYISLKNRHRYFVMLFINQFKNTLSELKILVNEELELSKL